MEDEHDKPDGVLPNLGPEAFHDHLKNLTETYGNESQATHIVRKYEFQLDLSNLSCM